MKTIVRARNSGKTTMLLYYMEICDDTVFVARTLDIAKKAHRLSDDLGLNLDIRRFWSVADVKVKMGECGVIRPHVVLDDADYIAKYHPELSIYALRVAHVATFTLPG